MNCGLQFVKSCTHSLRSMSALVWLICKWLIHGCWSRAGASARPIARPACRGHAPSCEGIRRGESWAGRMAAGPGLTGKTGENPFAAAFPARHTASPCRFRPEPLTSNFHHAHLRLRMPELRSSFRGQAIHEGPPSHRLSSGRLRRAGEAEDRRRSWIHLQRQRFLHHRLSKRFLQGSGEEGF